MEPSTKPGIAKRFVRRVKDFGSGRKSKSHPTVSECSPHTTSPRRPPIPLAEDLAIQFPIASGAPASASHVTNTRNDSISHGGNDDRASTSSKNYEAITHHENPPSNDETHADAVRVTSISQTAVSQIKDTHSREEVELTQADAQLTSSVPQTSSTTPSDATSLLRMPGTKEAKRWDEARLEFEKKHEAEWNFLNDRLKTLATSDWSSKFITADLDLPQCIQQNSTSKEVVHRMKRWLPSLASVKSVVMPIAALDPNKLAPICCAIVFSTTELFVNGPNPEFRTKALDAYFEAANTISEWISYETTSIQEPTEGVKELGKELPNVYIMALHLMHDIQYATYKFQADSKLERLKAKATTTFKDHTVIWDERVKDIKRVRATLSRRRKAIEEENALGDKVAKILEWIKQKDDPEESLSKIENKITSERRSKNYAQCFLDLAEYRTWFEAFHQWEDTTTQPEVVPLPRVLWINGSYGTGKTTIAYRILLTLQALEVVQTPDEPLLIIPYFCSALGSKRPDCETVIRSLVRKLSWNSDYSVADPARSIYTKFSKGLKEDPSIDDWQQVLGDIILGYGATARLVFLVDALDEFTDITEGAHFLDRMRKVADMHPNVYLIFMSHHYVRVDRYFDRSILLQYEVRQGDTKKDVEAFIDTEIAFRRQAPGSKESIFFTAGHKELETKMRQLLLDRARGMFVWIKVWLQILLPTHHPQKTVLSANRAQHLLAELDDSKNDTQDEQLRTAYQRLWTQNEYDDFVETRRDLFRFVLCWLTPLSIQELTKILRVGHDHKGSHYESLTEEWVRTLGADFLTIDTESIITFAHDSARHFVLGLAEDGQQSPNTAQPLLFQSEKSHRQVMRLFNTLFGSPGQSVHDYEFIHSLGEYFERHLPRHCELAVLDPLVVDSSWETLFDGTSSTFHAWLVSGQPCKTRFTIPPEIIQDDSVSCKAAWLGFPWSRAVSDKYFETLGQDRQYWGEQERYLKRRLDGSLDFGALTVATKSHNRYVGLFLLLGVHHLHGRAIVLELISSFCDFAGSSESVQKFLGSNKKLYLGVFFRKPMALNFFLDHITQRWEDAENAAEHTEKLETVRKQVGGLRELMLIAKYSSKSSGTSA